MPDVPDSSPSTDPRQDDAEQIIVRAMCRPCGKGGTTVKYVPADEMPVDCPACGREMVEVGRATRGEWEARS